MEYLFVVYFLISGEWIRGDDMEMDGWASLPVATLEECLKRKARADEIHADLMRSDPRVLDKRFDCEPRENASNG